jgi:hypothetical protein
MPQSFYDNFERPDGALGPLWTGNVNSWVILDGRAKAIGISTVQPAVDFPLRNRQVSATVNPVTPKAGYIHVYARANSLFTRALYIQWLPQVSTQTVNIVRAWDGGYTTLGSGSLVVPFDRPLALMVRAVGDRIEGWLDGKLVVVGYDSLVADHIVVGVNTYNCAAHLDDFSAQEYEATPLVVLPDAGNVPGSDQLLHLYNTADPWTPGTPGAPTFGSNFDAIYSQTVVSAGYATVLYRPPTLELSDLIVDPLNGTSAPVDLTTSYQTPGSGGSGGETDPRLVTFLDWMLGLSTPADETPWAQLMEMIAKLNGTGPTNGGDIAEVIRQLTVDDTYPDTLRHLIIAAASLAGETLTAQNAMTDVGAYTLHGLLDQIRGPQSVSNTTLRLEVEQFENAATSYLQTIVNVLWEIRTAGGYSFGSVKTWTDAIKAAVDALEAGDNQEVLDAIAAARGSGNPSLATLLTAINLRPTNPVTSLQPAIDAANNANNSVVAARSAIIDAINGIQTNGGANLWDVLNTVAGNLVDAPSKLVAITGLINALTPLVQDILDLLRDPPASTTNPPIWPGIANVTMGDPVPLAVGVTIDGTMDGVIVDLTHVPSAVGSYNFDGNRSYVHVGTLAFKNDIGAYEVAQPYSFGKHLLLPKSMVKAAGCVLRCREGVLGTVTPWVRMVSPLP